MEPSLPSEISNEPPPAQTSTETEDVPACQSCRKRKLKCSREMPSCSQCHRLGCPCLYDHKKQKPGLKSGAIESLNRRLEVLEKILLDSEGNEKAPPARLDAQDVQGCVYHASLLIANELKNIGSTSGVDDQNNAPKPRGLPKAATLNCQRSSPEGEEDREPGSGLSETPSYKKRKRGYAQYHDSQQSWTNLDDEDSIPPLPSESILEAIVETYFSKIQPWIPFLHMPSFRLRLKDQRERPKIKVLLHSIVSATMKHLKLADFGIDYVEMRRQVRVSRNVVTLHAMGSLSVENLQALIILAFDYMGEGHISKAWPIIGSLSRTVEYLQLTVEPDDVQQQPLLRPLILLEKPKQWTQVEMRRRVFWNVFLLDRFCSVSSGWSTSLTSDDVRRRLPCNGEAWFKDEPAATPYFGIWDKSAAKIGNSIAYIRALFPSSDEQSHMNDSSPSGRLGYSEVDTSKLGAFAYRIESTESLSQVTSFFLQQKVDFRNRQEVGAWLTRFKELDLRLVHWKMFLPQKWKDSNVSGDNSLVKMDPNLTLAHITHNTSMILLHQHLAYPPCEWRHIMKLPSSCSAETCQLAAVETSSIAEKYLKYTDGILTSQFAFCAFVAARIFLVHWLFYNTLLAPEFHSLIKSLEKMSQRWQGYSLVEHRESSDADRKELDMAGRYASQLRELHEKCQEDHKFYMQILGYSENSKITGRYTVDSAPGISSAYLSKTNTSRPFVKDSSWSSGMSAYRHRENSTFYDQRMRNSAIGSSTSTNGPPSYTPSISSTTSAVSNQPRFYGLQHQQHSTPSPLAEPYISHVEINNNLSEATSGLGGMGDGADTTQDALSVMSQSLLDQQFMELDRVITLEGTDFNFNVSAWGNL